MKRVAHWKILGAMLASDIVYFVALFFIFGLLRGTAVTKFASNWLLFWYFVLPSVMNLVGLFLSGMLVRGTPLLRMVSLPAWSVILPWAVFYGIVFGAMYGCQLDLFPTCPPL